MIVNSAKEYRTWFKTQEDRLDVNEDFMGCSHGTDNRKIKGFFNLFHGKKDDIERYLPSLLDIAEDNQAIYEFLQNAVDCGATHFWAFYNDKYFLAVNNGAKFSLEGLSSILNIAQSTKITSSNIGRLGIGFKLAHRLVGKGNGTHELIHENKGPVMFSWDSSSQLQSIMSQEEIYCEGLDNNPFLLKIAITNFPANVNETVKDVFYHDVIVFPEDELKEFRSYTKECLLDLFTESSHSFNQGTLFFIKLGENKRQLLDADLATLKNGIEYSMNTLKQLNNICFNGESISKKQLVINESSISKDSDKFMEIDPQYKEYDILYSYGYLPLDFNDVDYYKSVKQLQQSPNFYKYFPMGDEVDNMALFIHSDCFQIEANRRKLINHHTNRLLLPEIASFIITSLNNYKSQDRSKYLQLYASILLTDKPLSQEKTWMHSVFFDKLYSAIKSCVPTLDGTSDDYSNVIIKKTNIDIPLEQIGHSDKQWFAWSGNINKEILTEAVNKDKLGIEEWNINSIIVNADIDKLNSWLDGCSDQLFDAFINEIKSTTTSNEAKEILPRIKLIKFGNERKSRNEIENDNKYIILTEQTNKIKAILKKIGMICSDITIESHPLSSLLKGQDKSKLYSYIKNFSEENASKLNSQEKLSLVTSLPASLDVSDNSIKQLKLFKNQKGDLCCLGNLMAYKDNVENWLMPYTIAEDEDSEVLHNYLVPAEKLYNDIIGNYYESILDGGTRIDELYKYYQDHNHPWDSTLSINLIKKYGATEEILSLIEKTSDKNSVEEFFKKMEFLHLSTQLSYDSTSFQYRCIQLASKVEATILRSKIKVDGILLTEFASSDTISFKIKVNNKESTYDIKLSDVIPDDTQCAIYGKIAEKFSSIQNYKKIFSADSNNITNVDDRLLKILRPSGALITPAQYAFILLRMASSNNTNLGYWHNYVRIENYTQITGIINYCYINSLFPILESFKSASPFSSFIRNKYLFSRDFTIESERADLSIERWCGSDNEKKSALVSLGMHFNDSAEIKRRIAFKNDTMSTWNAEESATFSPFLEWVCSIKPVNGNNQKKLLLTLCHDPKISKSTLRMDFNEEDFSNARELETDKYWKWQKERGIHIFHINSEMPCRIIYDNDSNKILCNIKNGEYHYFENSKHLYIKGSGESEIAGSLAKVYNDIPNFFSYEDYVNVCFNSPEEQRELNEEFKIYKDFYKRYHSDKQQEEDQDKELYLKKYSERLKEFMGSDYSLPTNEIKTNHVIARYRALMYIKRLRETYSLQPGFDEKFFIKEDRYTHIPLADGKHINIQGARYGIWYLSPTIWKDVIDNGNYVCLCTGNGEYDFLMIKGKEDFKAIADGTKNAFIRLTPTANMDIIDTINSMFSSKNVVLNDGIVVETTYQNRNVHLMLMVHPTPEPALNSIFDKIFNTEGDFVITSDLEE